MNAGKLVTLGIAIVALAACGGGGDGRSAASPDWNEGEGQEQDQPALAVEALEVSRGSLLQTVEASGTVRGVNEVSIVAEVEGPIESAALNLGDSVAPGTVLLQVESTVARLNVEEARQALESANLDLTATQRQFENGSASQAELTRARSAANGAQARYQAAMEVLDDHTIRSPLAGAIASRGQGLTPGNYLSRGTVVARIVNLNTVEMEIAVGERELTYLREGIPATVRIPACGDQPAQARVTSIAAGSDPRTGSFPVVIRWDNPCEQLRSGMSATVTIRPSDDQPPIIVPNAAIRNDGEGDYVFVAAGNAAERRGVEVGERLGDRVQIVSGLEVGEIILTSALSALSDGRSVEASVRGRTGDVL